LIHFCVVNNIDYWLKLFLSHPVAFNKFCRMVDCRVEILAASKVSLQCNSVRILQCKNSRCAFYMRLWCAGTAAVCWPCTAQNRFSQCSSSDGVATKTRGDRRSRSLRTRSLVRHNFFHDGCARARRSAASLLSYKLL